MPIRAVRSVLVSRLLVDVDEAGHKTDGEDDVKDVHGGNSTDALPDVQASPAFCAARFVAHRCRYGRAVEGSAGLTF